MESSLGTPLVPFIFPCTRVLNKLFHKSQKWLGCLFVVVCELFKGPC